MDMHSLSEKVLGLLKKVLDRIPRKNLEIFAMKGMAALWAATVLGVIFMAVASGFKGDLETRIIRHATKAGYKFIDEERVEFYKSFATALQNPEFKSTYTQGITRDPFLAYEKGHFQAAATSNIHDFDLREVKRMMLPMVYKGYIELPTYVVGQINWENDTIFVKDGSMLYEMEIKHVQKSRITALDKKGREVIMELEKPVFSNELEAVLYDSISGQFYTIHQDAMIDQYKVVDITHDYVILISEGKEIKLERQLTSAN